MGLAIVYLDYLVQICGHFDANATTNNGYGCRHPKQDDRDATTGEGRCFTFSCPVAMKIDPSQNCKESATLDREILREAGWDADEIDTVSEESALMQVHDAALNSAIEAMWQCPQCKTQNAGGALCRFCSVAKT
jgi:hypothetical protein